MYDSYDVAGNQSGRHVSRSYTVSEKGKYIVVALAGIRPYVSNMSLVVSYNGSSVTLEAKLIQSQYSCVKMAYGILNCDVGKIISAYTTGGDVSGDDAHFVQLLVYKI